MTGPCPYICSNKNSFGYCHSTVRINPEYNQHSSTISTNVTLTDSQLRRLIEIMSDDELNRLLKLLTDKYV